MFTVNKKKYEIKEMKQQKQIMNEEMKGKEKNCKCVFSNFDYFFIFFHFYKFKTKETHFVSSFFFAYVFLIYIIVSILAANICILIP